MKKLYLFLIGFGVLICVSAFAQKETAPGLDSKPRFDVGVGYWYTWGSLNNTHVAVSNNPGLWLKGQKLQEIHYDSDAGMFVINLDAYLFWRIYADGFAAFGNIDGDQKYSEWLPEISSAKESESISDANGDVRTWNANGYIRLLEKPNTNSFFDISAGYVYYRDNFSEQPNPVETIVDFMPVNNPVTGADDDNDKYTFDGLRLGARARFELTERIAVKGGVGLSPWLSAEREALFHLLASPNDSNVLGQHVEASANAFGFDANIGIEFKITNNLFIEGGYRYINIDTDVGDRSFSWDDGTVLNFNDGWKNAKVERSGVYLMGRLKI